MLKSPDDDTRCYALFISETAYGRTPVYALRDESPPVGPGNQKIRSPVVRLGLKVVPAGVGFVNEYVLLAMKEDMRGLVEQAEPEVVVGFMAGAESDDGFAGG